MENKEVEVPGDNNINNNEAKQEPTFGEKHGGTVLIAMFFGMAVVLVLAKVFLLE